MVEGDKVIKLRSAEKKDKEGILSIASATWEGWDYVPLFLDSWIDEGGLYVAEYEGSIVGITKTTELGKGELWLEAIRVAEEHRGKGWGFRIARIQLDYALAANPRNIRLSTADINAASLAVIRRLGFTIYAEFDYFLTDEPPTPSSQHRQQAQATVQVKPGESSSVWKLICDSEEYGASRGLLPHTWKFYDWTRERFDELVVAGLVFQPRDARGVVVFVKNRYTPQNLELAFIEGEDTALASLVGFVQERFTQAASEASDGKYAAYAAGQRKCEIIRRIGLKPHPRVHKVKVFDYPLLHPDEKT